MPSTAITPRGIPERFSYLFKLRSPRPETTAARRGDLPPPLAISAGLEPYTEPLDRRKVAHLLRRVGFGSASEDLNALPGMPGHEAAAMLVDEVVALPMPDPPEWANAFPPSWDGSDEVLQAYFDKQFPWFEEHAVDWLCTVASIERLRSRRTDHGEEGRKNKTQADYRCRRNPSSEIL